MVNQRGHWGRGALFWAARKTCGMTLAEIGHRAGGKDYAAIAMAIRRYEEHMCKKPDGKNAHKSMVILLNVMT
jgi:hypothetical protein